MYERWGGSPPPALGYGQGLRISCLETLPTSYLYKRVFIYIGYKETSSDHSWRRSHCACITIILTCHMVLCIYVCLLVNPLKSTQPIGSIFCIDYSQISEQNCRKISNLIFNLFYSS